MNSHDAVSRQADCRIKVVILAVLFVFSIFPAVYGGTALRLYYKNIVGNAVADLLSHPSFPASPSTVEVISAKTERIEYASDDWGSWTRGYLEAPQTGKYTFYLASDNNSEFWLSKTHLAFEVSKVMENPRVLPIRDYRVQSEQIELVQGQEYYFELYHKEGTGLDHISLGWKLPDGTLERPIPSRRLMPVSVDQRYQTVERPPQFLTTYFSRPVSTLTNMTVSEGESIVLESSVEGTQPISFQWFEDNVPVPGANLASLTLTNLSLNLGGITYRLQASNELGAVSAEARVTVLRDDSLPEVISALNLGQSNTIAVVFSRAVDPVSASFASNYELNHGATVRSAKLVSKGTVHLQASSLPLGKTHTVKVKNVKDLLRRNIVVEHRPLEVERGLYLWLQFDEKEDDVVADASGNFNAAVLVNGATLNRSGVLGSCLELDGKDDHAILPGGFSNFTNGMTIAVWAKPTANGEWSRFTDFGNGYARENILFAREHSSNHLVFETYTVGANGPKQTRALIRDLISQNTWQHLAASMDNQGVVSFYKDGVLAGKQKTMIPDVIERTSNLIGRSNWDGDAHYKGYMDDLRVYERALSAAEIEALARP